MRNNQNNKCRTSGGSKAEKHHSRAAIIRYTAICLIIVAVSFFQTIKILPNRSNNYSMGKMAYVLQSQPLRIRRLESKHIQNSNSNQMPFNLYFEIEKVMSERKETKKDREGTEDSYHKKQEKYVKNKGKNFSEDYNQDSLNIPEKFANDRQIFAVDSIIRRPFPRWNFDDNASTNEVSIMESIIDFVKQEEDYFRTFSGNREDNCNFGKRNPIHTTDHLQMYTPDWWFPEALYIVDSKEIYTSEFTKKLSDIQTGAIEYKYNPTEKLMRVGLALLQNTTAEQGKNRWPRLFKLLIEEKGSFPFLAHYSDFIGCNYHNWKDNTQSIPLFTVAADVTCNHTFPFPTSALFFDAMPNNHLYWEHRMRESSNQYPKFINKKPRVVWRGSLTGHMPEEVAERGPRWHLTKLVHSDGLSQTDRDLFDVKLTHIPSCTQFDYINGDELGGVSYDDKMIMEDMQHYKAILDVDGHSWSSRFAKLLCFNSVVLKVEPKYVDYFYFPATQDEYALKPWKHYIPVKYDLSDLIEKTAYAVNVDNEERVISIIQKANEWCMHKFSHNAIGHDVLDIWEKYVVVLDRSDSMKTQFSTSSNSNNVMVWEKQWNEIKEDILKGPLAMVAAAHISYTELENIVAPNYM